MATKSNLIRKVDLIVIEQGSYKIRYALEVNEYDTDGSLVNQLCRTLIVRKKSDMVNDIVMEVMATLVNIYF